MMFKNQLQEIAQRSCFNLPSYACLRVGPDHAPRFKASVNFNGEIFECPNYCTTLRQAEHAAAEVALNALSSKGPSRSLTARVLDETGIYKNLLQETAHRAGLNLPAYTTIRSGPGHAPVFTSTVEIAGVSFTGEPAKAKKQAEKNAAWSALKTIPNSDLLGIQQGGAAHEDQDQAVFVTRRPLSNFFKSKDDDDDDDEHSKQAMRIDYQMDHSRQARRRMITSSHYSSSNTLVSSSSSSSSSSLDHSSKNHQQPWKLLNPQLESEKIKEAEAVPSWVLEEHLKDEEEWLGRTAISKWKPLNSHTIGRFNLRPYKVAPAVQIRSVIPVCSAPPPAAALGPVKSAWNCTTSNSEVKESGGGGGAAAADNGRR